MSYSCQVTPCSPVLWQYSSSHEFGQSAEHFDHSIPRTNTLLSPSNLSDFLAGLIQKNAKFKLFTKHLYKNVRCAFAEVELAIINVSTTKSLKVENKDLNYLANIMEET